MPTATLTKPKVAQQTGHQLPVQPEKPNRFAIKPPAAVLIASIACFAITSFLTIRHHLSPRVVELSVLFDSASYLNSATQVHECIRNLLSHPITIDSIQHTAKLLSGALLLDGPVLPTLGAAYYGLIQQVPTVFDMRPALVLQSLLHGLSAGLIVVLGTRFTGRLLWGVLASFAWGLYPAAAIGSANFMSETLTVTLIVAQLLCVSHWVDEDSTSRKWPHTKAAWAAASGILAALLILLKPALSVACVAAVAAALIGMRLTHHTFTLVGKRAMALAAGFFVAVVPWLIFTYTATGQAVLTPQRMPVKNLATGLNLETKGWGAIPDTDFVSLFSEEDKPLPTLIGLIAQHPVEHASLMASKLSRLWAAPWNDYRQKFLFAATAAQVRWHQAFLSLSLVGMLWFFLSIGKKSLSWIGSDRKFWLPIGLVSMAVVAGHLLYLPFAANSRYGFTAMPAFLMFALFAVMLGVRGSSKTIIRVVGAAAALMAAFSIDAVSFIDNVVTVVHAPVLDAIEVSQLAIILQTTLWGVAILLAFSAFNQVSTVSRKGKVALLAIWLIAAALIALTVFGADREWNARLSPNQSICRSLPRVRLASPTKHTLLLVDCSEQATADFVINGHHVPAMLSPISFLDGSGNLLRDMQLFGGISGAGAQKMRQWRYAEIPTRWLSSTHENVIKMNCENPVTIYGDYVNDTELVKVPALWNFSATRLLSDPTSADARIPAVLPTHRERDRAFIETANTADTTKVRTESLDRRAPRLLLAFLYDKTKHSEKPTIRNWSGTVAGALHSDGITPIKINCDVPTPLLYQGTLNLVLSMNAEALPAAAAQAGAKLADIHVCLRNKTQLGHDVEFVGGAPIIAVDGKTVEFKAVLPTAVISQGDHYIDAVIRPHGFGMSLTNVRVKLDSKAAPKIGSHAHLRVI